MEDLTREQWLERTALCGEELMESYLEHGRLTVPDIREAIRRRQLFPCYFGSALKLMGVEELLQGVARYTYEPVYGQELAARDWWGYDQIAWFGCIRLKGMQTAIV